MLQRITISIDEDLLGIVDRMCESRGYASRSEAMRDLLREAASRHRIDVDGSTPCVGVLSYVYEHETRDLSQRLTSTQHHHRTLSVSTLHVHLDNDVCLEVAVLKGSAGQMREIADGVVTQRGVRLGNLSLLPIGKI